MVSDSLFLTVRRCSANPLGIKRYLYQGIPLFLLLACSGAYKFKLLCVSGVWRQCDCFAGAKVGWRTASEHSIAPCGDQVDHLCNLSCPRQVLFSHLQKALFIYIGKSSISENMLNLTCCTRPSIKQQCRHLGTSHRSHFADGKMGKSQKRE